MTNNLAQRAADELNVEGEGWSASPSMCLTIRAHQTVSRLIAKNDELQTELDELARSSLNFWRSAQNAQPKRRSEPMPEPVPDYIKRKACEELVKDDVYTTTQGLADVLDWEPGRMSHSYARLIWERGDVQEVDPVEALAREALAAWYRSDQAVATAHNSEDFAAMVAVLKRGMELQKEIG